MRILAQLLVFALSLITGCRPTFPTDPGCPESSQFQLALDGTLLTQFRRPPIALGRINDSAFFALSDLGAVSTVTPSAVERISVGFSVVAGLGTLPGGITAFSGGRIAAFSDNIDGWRELEVGSSFSDIRATAAATSGDREIWVVEGSEETRRVLLLEPTDPIESKYSVAREWALPGNWHLIPVGAEDAVLVSTRPPFHTYRLSGSGSPERIGGLGRDLDLEEIDQNAPIYLAGAVRLDCSAVLVTLADLGSNSRWLVIFDSRNGKVKKQGRLDATMGFFASDPVTSSVYAFRDTKEGGEVLTYRWSWVDQK